MKYISREDIERRAHELLRSHDAYEVPVPLELVAHRLGLKVQRVPLGESISGVLVLSDGGGMIGVNSDQPEVRQRFTIAHELGHFLLHKGKSELFIDRTFVAFRNSSSATGKERVEIQANQFAAALLMPEELLSREAMDMVIDLAEGDLINTLADRFGVSSQSMTFRLENLKMLGPA
ncbi:MAG: ImmA/IrrE family metallo-endopeptidase [Gemmatimonadales bacterium]|nr:ImmA/IrrE family metallo-endopeptidase [Gemmatimonadales bacterium]MDZ4389921.1 ImmA/IrrE family metallo-endopeptidase [Gemmatimonadales bacterium]